MDAELEGILSDDGVKRRDFIVMVAGSMAGVGVVSSCWPLLKSMSPSASVLAMATTEVNINGIREGQNIKVKWQGKPVFIRRRSASEIQRLRAVDVSALRDPEEDMARVKKAEWLVVLGVCTHLGCVPIERNAEQGGGWVCPCHGSYYDNSGRILRGPAPHNLQVPDYYFASDNVIVIGRAKEV